MLYTLAFTQENFPFTTNLAACHFIQKTSVTKEQLLCSGQYASCLHTGGLSYIFSLSTLCWGVPVSVKGKFFDTKFGLIHVQTGKKNFCRGTPFPVKGKFFDTRFGLIHVQTGNFFFFQIWLDTCSDWKKFFFCQRTPPPRIARNCYGHAAGSMPLAFTQEDFLVITIYRRPNSISIQHFMELLQKLLSKPTLHRKNIVILGDFNEDLIDNKTNIHNFFQQHGFKQLIIDPTTNQGSLLDHIYFNATSTTQTEVCDTYYSDHDSTLLAIRTVLKSPH